MKQELEFEKVSRFQRIVPIRVLFVILSCFGFILVYAFKVVVSMSIVTMVNSTTGISSNNSGRYDTNNGYCPANGANQTATSTANKLGEFDWDDTIKSQILGAFFYGYVVSQFPAGIVATRFGGKLIFGTSLFVAALLSLISPLAARYDYRMFIAVRILQGFVEGTVFPTMSVLISNWMPKMERSRGTTIIFTGSQIGTVLTLPITSALCNSTILGGWPSIYYLLGVVGIVWYAIFMVLVYETPEVHPYISDKERRYIIENGGGMRTVEKFSVPYREIFTSIPVWALILCNFGQNWAFLTVLNLMPTYMNDILHTTETQNTLVSGLPYLGQALFGWSMSWVSDKLRKSGRFEITTIRKIDCSIGNLVYTLFIDDVFFRNVIAYFPTAIFILLIPVFGCNIGASLMMFILTITLNGASYPGLASTHVDMAPDFSGVLTGIANGLGNIPGFLTTIVASQFTKNGKTVHNWSYVFYISAAVNVLTGLIYCVFASARQQPWGTRKELKLSQEEQQQQAEKEIEEESKNKIYLKTNSYLNKR